MLRHQTRLSRVRLLDFEFIACKKSVFSSLRLNGSNPCVSVEMRSNGEVAYVGRDVHEACLEAMVAGDSKLPSEPCDIVLFIGGRRENKETILQYMPMLAVMSISALMDEVGPEKLVRTAQSVERERQNWIVLQSQLVDEHQEVSESMITVTEESAADRFTSTYGGVRAGSGRGRVDGERQAQGPEHALLGGHLTEHGDEELTGFRWRGA